MTRVDGQPPGTAFEQYLCNPWAQDIQRDFPPTANITITHPETENVALTSDASHLYRESMVGAFAGSHVITRLNLETSHPGEPVEDLASLLPFLGSEASPRDISKLGSINEAAMPKGSPNLLPAYRGTTFGMFPEPERESMKPWVLSPGLPDTPYQASALTMEGCESHSGEMDTEVDMICYGMVSCFFL